MGVLATWRPPRRTCSCLVSPFSSLFSRSTFSATPCATHSTPDRRSNPSDDEIPCQAVVVGGADALRRQRADVPAVLRAAPRSGHRHVPEELRHGSPRPLAG